MIFWLAPAHLALTIIILIWDIVLAGPSATVFETRSQDAA